MDPKTRRTRRRILIGIALFLALLLPIVAILAAVSDAYPGYVCGRWWYGMIIAGLFISQKNSG